MGGKRNLLVLFLVSLLVSNSAGAASVLTVLEETGFIVGLAGQNFSFVPHQAAPAYEVTLTDLEFPAALDFLGVAITTSTDNVVELVGPGTAKFGAVPGTTTYFANVLGNAANPPGAGLFGLRITAVPLPAGIWLLGSNLVGLFFLRRRQMKRH